MLFKLTLTMRLPISVMRQGRWSGLFWDADAVLLLNSPIVVINPRTHVTNWRIMDPVDVKGSPRSQVNHDHDQRFEDISASEPFAQITQHHYVFRPFLKSFRRMRPRLSKLG